MQNNIFIPEKINVGFQTRTDTYTGKLAYVIYFDNKGVLRKETSWNSWRDTKIANEIYENKPMSGFVLNKRVGDYKSGWNHRQSYVRVYDPRGFEFELTIPNLLYILENTSSIKGKGLEGEFVYGYAGSDLVLLPTCSPDYEELTSFNDKLRSKETVKVKNLVLGATYLNKKNEELVYMGRYDVWGIEYGRSEWSRPSGGYIKQAPDKDINKGAHFIFVRRNGEAIIFEQFKSISGRLVSVVLDTCVGDYAELFELMETKTWYSPIDKSKDEWVPLSFEEFDKLTSDERSYYKIRGLMPVEIDKNLPPPVSLGNNMCEFGYYYWFWERSFAKQHSSAKQHIYNYCRPHVLTQYLRNGKKFTGGY